MKKIAGILFIWLPLMLFAQQKESTPFIDSLVSKLAVQKEDTNKEKLLHGIAYAYLQVDPAQALYYTNQELALAQRLGYKRGVASCYYLLGGYFNSQGNSPEALKNASLALDLFKELKDQKGISSSYTSMGLIFSALDDYPEALKNYYSALRIEEELNSISGQAACYVNIGSIYSFQKNYSQALFCYDSALKIGVRLDKKILIATCRQNIADIYIAQNQPGEAQKNALSALDICTALNDRYGMAVSENTIGVSYNLQKNYREALKHCLASGDMLTGLGMNLQLSNTIGAIGDIFYNQKKYADALKYYTTQLKLAKDVGSRATIKDAYNALGAVYGQQGEYKKALEMYKLYDETKDSIYSEASIQKELETKLQYDLGHKEALSKIVEQKKDAAQKLQIQKKNTIICGALFALCALIIISGLLIRQYKLKADHERIELEQQQLRAQMNPHFIFNCLNSIQHFVVANDVKNTNKYLSGFALLMRQTLENSKESYVSLRTEIGYLKNYLSLEAMLFEDKFAYEIVCADNLDLDAPEIPGMIIQPYVENAIHHGLRYLTGRQGVLKINFYAARGNLFCEIDDNGIGMARSRELKKEYATDHKSHGMQLTMRRLLLAAKHSKLDYTIAVKIKEDSGGSGTCITIKFPINV